jgi:hypothetical protein
MTLEYVAQEKDFLTSSLIAAASKANQSLLLRSHTRAFLTGALLTRGLLLWSLHDITVGELGKETVDELPITVQFLSTLLGTSFLCKLLL